MEQVFIFRVLLRNFGMNSPFKAIKYLKCNEMILVK